jgi:acetyl-CoA carboxylase carboxyl transferase subunit beta
MSILVWMNERRIYEEKMADPVYSQLSEVQRNAVDYPGGVGLWTKCDFCGVVLYKRHVRRDLHVCEKCGMNLRMDATNRIKSLIDEDTWRPMFDQLSAIDPLEFADKKSYLQRLEESQERTGFQDAVEVGTGLMNGIPVALGVMSFDFMGGSMGSVVGEKIARLIEYATQKGLVLILVCASGGARMQEGIFSLMQMAKISAALHNHQCYAKLLYISILTSPTTGGVTASFAMLGDVIIAEPKAVIGFAGRRVIEQTLNEILPDNFQTAEYLMSHGLVDLIVERKFLKDSILSVIDFNSLAPLKPKGVKL